MSVFNNPTDQSTINELNRTLFGSLVGFGMFSSSNTTYYYVMDYEAGKVYILNDQWSFISFELFTRFYDFNQQQSLYDW